MPRNNAAAQWRPESCALKSESESKMISKLGAVLGRARNSCRLENNNLSRQKPQAATRFLLNCLLFSIALSMQVGQPSGAQLLPSPLEPRSDEAPANAATNAPLKDYYSLHDAATLEEDFAKLATLSEAPAGDHDDQLRASGSTARTSRQASGAPEAATQQTTPLEESDEPQLNAQFAYDYHSNMPVITKRELANSIKQATISVDKRLAADSTIGASGAEMDPTSSNEVALMETGSSGWLASSMFHKPAPSDELSWNQTRQSMISEEATRLLAKQYKLNRHQVLRGLPLISVDSTALGKQCPRQSRQFSCIPGQYRSLSGHCNNVQNPDWAAASTPLVRYAPARYQDNVARPVRSSSARPTTSTQAAGGGGEGALLPSARQVSMAIYEGQAKASDQVARQQQHSHMTTMLSFFGQLLFHDLAFVASFSRRLKCCATGAQRHPECMPIEFRSDPTGSYCLDYVRSATAVRVGCNLGARDQLNLVSSYLDGSAIYGSSEAQMRALRSFSGGRLRSQRMPAAGQSSIEPLELLPQIRSVSNTTTSQLLELDDNSWLPAAEECKQIAEMRQRGKQQQHQLNYQAGQANNCFQAGDIRVNENIGLTLMHTIWMREHNRIADQLAALNAHWRDERLFQEARRIVVAQLQHITYSEFLPSILGDEVMQRFNLTTLSQGYQQNYDPQLNAAVSNELAAAVFPFILSTIPSQLERYSERLEMLGRIKLQDTFMDGSELFKRNKFAQYLTGMMSQNAMEPALALMPMTQVATNAETRRSSNVTLGGGAPPELDAVALTIQQGRDHGLKPYLYWRRLCQLKPEVRSWQDLSQVMPVDTVERLRRVYASVEQLDLYLGLLERPAPGATLGPTFVCLLARQFFHTKFGDRFWFENDLPGLAFSARQLDEIRQSSLAKVVCRNSQSSISFIQPAPMLSSDPYLNAYQYCTNKAMGELDLSRWKQTVTSAQLVADEQLVSELSAGGLQARPRSLARGKRLIETHSDLMKRSLDKAQGQLEQVARQEAARIRQAMAARVRSKRQAGAQNHHHHHQLAAGAGYRHLPRPKRQVLKINNQSVILELATNEVVRSLLNQGKDREQAQSVQMDIRDFLYSLEAIQLENLLDNSATSDALSQFIASANGFFLTEEQRSRLAAAGDSILAANDLALASADQTTTALQDSGRSSSVSMNCQDDERAFPCDHTTPFRTITGWCNNLQNPKFGQSFTLHDRILPSAYEDGLSKPRSLSVALEPRQPGERLRLPSPRLVSTSVHDDKSQLHARYSLALMQFGQFGVDHDLTRTPFSVAIDGSLLDCSACDSQRSLHRDCLPIEVPENDAHFKGAKRCLHFVRSLNGQTALGPRQQINALTAYLDASEIYGSDNCEAKSLRSFTGGRLNSSAYPIVSGQNLGYKPREILPVTRANPECVTPSGWCFHAGDQRASEQPALTAIHTIFMRFHNTIVQQLAQINRHWNDERLYQQGRRIVGAIVQRITYNEFAPRLLGLDYMSKFDLILKQVGYSNDYDETCSASIMTEFASAAFRMGHSLIRASFPLLNRQYKQASKNIQLRTAFFNSHRILSEPQLIDSILRGIVSTPIETLDNSVTEELTNHLFERAREPHSGMDLISLNIQRARDHGIDGYNKYRSKCNLTRAKTFDDLSGEIPQRLIKRLSNLYAHVDDIDLFTGGLSELPVHGGIIGPTFGCIIGMQLERLKKCDRFWHETNDPYVRFSLAQLAELRKITLSKVICSQSDTIEMIQRNAMDVPDHYLNPRVSCSSLPWLDFSVWRENQKSCLVNKIKLELGQTKRVNPCRSCTCTLEGPVCRTAKINCLKMMRKLSGLSMNQVMADKSCLVQCAWALDMQQLAATG